MLGILPETDWDCQRLQRLLIQGSAPKWSVALLAVLADYQATQ